MVPSKILKHFCPDCNNSKVSAWKDGRNIEQGIYGNAHENGVHVSLCR